MTTELTIFAPATSANLGPGFDCLGLALPFGNRFRVQRAERASGHSYRFVGSDEKLDEESNLFLLAAKQLAVRAETRLPALDVVVAAGIPLSRGLGSSASAVVAGLLAGNRLLGDPLDREAILGLATEIEGHPDNVVPALLGGMTVAVKAGDRVVQAPLPLASALGLVAAIPAFTLSTKAARAALPAVVPFEDAVYNVGRTALLTAALVTGRHELLVDALGDRLHEPYRQAFVPGMREVVAAARTAGAFGVTLSGAGPTLLAWCPPHLRSGVAASMTTAWQSVGVACRTIVTEVATVGTTIDEGSPWL